MFLHVSEASTFKISRIYMTVFPTLDLEDAEAEIRKDVAIFSLFHALINH